MDRRKTELKPSTVAGYSQILSARIIPDWGTRRIASIRSSEVQAWVSAMPISGKTAREQHAILAQILDLAVDDRLITTNPARGISLPRRNPPVKV
ncbi:N-terminal phage integrase SAM-like domain-containing protein [Corynebacterium choanae]|uniref:Integrase SAM-like N-terminal domain-containing protein n=1 Tax=Corynebacterium choanae TaxID=1862358 RepID=A0A3G6J8A6_9CORY|nr:N-terminal phage integrase SAM-like domain-containing protein [Corynebacterium choanae]AZA14042.1 hypothetical protein CCHOA_08255 [Corynebacterium choanae]